VSGSGSILGGRSGLVSEKTALSMKAAVSGVEGSAPVAPSARQETPVELRDRLFREDQRPIVLYDGICGMCNTAVDVALNGDPEGKIFRFAALQSNVGRGLLSVCGREPDDLSSMVVVEADGTCLVQSAAALFVGRKLEQSPVLRGASEAASRLIPKAVRDLAYDALAANRYKVLGTRDMRLGEEARTDRFIPDNP